MDTKLENAFPYEGIPELILAFCSPEQKHEFGSELLKKKMEDKYLEPEHFINDRVFRPVHFNGKVHNFDRDFEHIVVDNTDWSINYTATFCKYGKLHDNINGEPAFRMEGEFLHIEIHYKNGLIHRDGDLPADISWKKAWLPENEDTVEKWFIDGKLHREGGKPAIIFHGKPQVIEYWIRGEFIRKETKIEK